MNQFNAWVHLIFYKISLYLRKKSLIKLSARISIFLFLLIFPLSSFKGKTDSVVLMDISINGFNKSILKCFNFEVYLPLAYSESQIEGKRKSYPRIIKDSNLVCSINFN